MPLTFIHAADYHLGADLRRFGKAGRYLRKAQFQSLKNTIETAVEEKAAFILICGDIFDRRNPSSSVLRQTSEILSLCPEIPIYILPGTHDFLSPKSVLNQGRTGWAGKHVIVLNDPEISPLYLGNQDCRLHYCPNRSNRSSSSPINGMEKQTGPGLDIGLAHGSLKVMGLDPGYDFPIRPEDIAGSGLNYLALGHWHKPRVEIFGQTTAAYPGIPQPISWSDPGQGSILVVRLEDTGETEVLPRQVSEVDFREIRAKIYHPVEAERLFKKIDNPKTIVKMLLEYSDNLKEKQEVEDIVEKLSERLLLVQSDEKSNDKLPVSLNNPDKVNQQFIQAFRAELAHLKEADSPDRSELYEKAARLGTAIIAGEE
jgi:DNA repair exonuclease SbcCD nuclease subunit